MPGWAFVVVALVVPAVWATAVARVLRARAEKQARFVQPDKPPVDYTI